MMTLDPKRCTGREVFEVRELLCSSHSGKGTGLECSGCVRDLAEERDRLRAQLAESERRGKWTEVVFDQSRRHREELAKQLTELEADRVRLDWLAECGHAVQEEYDHDDCTVFVVREMCIEGVALGIGHSLRAAIDAARGEG